MDIGSVGANTALMLYLDRDLPGSLSRALQVFAKRGLCLSIIQPCPRMDRRWEYAFWCEYEAHVDALPIRDAVAQMRLQNLGEVVTVGCYANATASQVDRMRTRAS